MARRDEYNYFDAWESRDDEDYDISLDEYEESCGIDFYGSDFDADDDDDSYDPY